MTKIFVKMYTGYCGSDATEVVDVDFTEEQLKDLTSPEAVHCDELAQEMAIENAQMYGMDEVDEDSEFEEDPYENVSGHWEIFDLEKHEGDLTMDEYDRLKAELEGK